MNDIERRALLGAAGIGALAALGKAGPLNPPAGAVAGTGRTTDEIYNMIPGGGAGDGRTAIAGGSVNVTISQPGSYLLTGNLSSGGHSITINADDVTLDLNGFTVNCLSIAASALAIGAGRTRVTVRNGRLIGGSAVVRSLGILTHALFEDLNIQRGKLNGITIVTAGSAFLTVRRCIVSEIGSTTTAADGNTTIVAVHIAGSNGRIEDCTVTNTVYNGSGSGTIRAIAASALGGSESGSVVARCTVSQDAPTAGTGVVFAGSGVYRDNTVINFSSPYFGGTNGGGNV